MDCSFLSRSEGALFGGDWRSLRISTTRPRWSERLEPFVPRIDDAEIYPGESYDAVARSGLRDADGFADKGLGDEVGSSTPFDLTVGPHPANLMIGIVPGLFDPARHWPWRRPVMVSRRRLIQRFVRSFGIVQPHHRTPTRLRSVRYFTRGIPGLGGSSMSMIASRRAAGQPSCAVFPARRRTGSNPSRRGCSSDRRTGWSARRRLPAWPRWSRWPNC